MDEAGKILEAIGALGEKVEGVRADIAGLKKTDEHLTEEVQRLGQEQKALRKDVDELRNETRRTFDAEREATKATNEAMVRYVNDSSKTFREKAADIDVVKTELATVKKETKEQSAELAKQTQMLGDIVAAVKHPMVRKILWGVGTLLLAWLASKGIK